MTLASCHVSDTIFDFLKIAHETINSQFLPLAFRLIKICPHTAMLHKKCQHVYLTPLFVKGHYTTPYWTISLTTIQRCIFSVS